MNYWVIKGTQRSGRNDFESMIHAQRLGSWQTRRRPKQLAQGDRAFVWESSPGLRLIALAEITNSNLGEEEGDQFYEIRYLTNILQQKPTIADLRETEGLQDASFLKSGPAVSVLPLRESEAAILFGVAAAANPQLNLIWTNLGDVADNIIPDIEVFSATEGKAKLVTHLRRERNRTLIDRMKNATLSSLGRLDCEACKFNFMEKYGDRGIDFCEVHHRIPLEESIGEFFTTLDYLAIVCSNCHRMLHVSPWMSVEKLKELLNR